jgi:hypothetical protein
LTACVKKAASKLQVIRVTFKLIDRAYLSVSKKMFQGIGFELVEFSRHENDPMEIGSKGSSG